MRKTNEDKIKELEHKIEVMKLEKTETSLIKKLENTLATEVNEVYNAQKYWLWWTFIVIAIIIFFIFGVITVF